MVGLSAESARPAHLCRPGRLQITGLEEKDIVFVRFEGEGGPHCLPYFIGLDHEKSAVVVSIRGTLSLEVGSGCSVWLQRPQHLAGVFVVIQYHMCQRRAQRASAFLNLDIIPVPLLRQRVRIRLPSSSDHCTVALPSAAHLRVCCSLPCTLPCDVNTQQLGVQCWDSFCCRRAFNCICCSTGLALRHAQDTMTDLLCESAKLDDWMKEVPSAGTPETFSAESPPKEEAGRRTG